MLGFLLENRVYLVIGLATGFYWSVLFYYNGTARKLKELPTVGSALPFLSLIGVVRFLKDVRSLIDVGNKKWPHRLFKIPTVVDWFVIVTDPKLIDEIGKAPEEVLSSGAAIDEDLQTRYTIGTQITTDPYHVPVVRGKLTRSIPKLVPVLYDEMIQVFSHYIPLTDDWSNIMLFDTLTKMVACVSNRIIVGLPLCKNPDWIKINIQFATDVVLTSMFLGLFPTFMRPILNFLFSSMPRHRRKAFQLFEPVITARRKERGEKDNEYVDKPNDLLSWLMDAAEGEEQEDRAILDRVLTLNFAAIHTSSLLLCHALFDLLSHPEYLQPLRKEAEEAVQREGWTKSAIDQMHKMDSFIKEVQRLHPIGFLLLKRVAVNDYVFSDGQKIPAGTTVTVPAFQTHLDPSVYENPLEFDGFRFLKMKENAKLDGNRTKNYDAVSTSAHSLSFSHGRHACPGRFFATVEVKMMMAYMIMTYDMKLTDGIRPPDVVFVTASVANPFAKVLFRQRQ